MIEPTTCQRVVSIDLEGPEDFFCGWPNQQKHGGESQHLESTRSYLIQSYTWFWVRVMTPCSFGYEGSVGCCRVSTD